MLFSAAAAKCCCYRCYCACARVKRSCSIATTATCVRRHKRTNALSLAVQPYRLTTLLLLLLLLCKSLEDAPLLLKGTSCYLKLALHGHTCQAAHKPTHGAHS